MVRFFRKVCTAHDCDFVLSWGGGGGLPYISHRHVPAQRVWFFGLFGLKAGINFAHFGLELGMDFEETTGVDVCIFVVSVPNEY